MRWARRALTLVAGGATFAGVLLLALPPSVPDAAAVGVDVQAVSPVVRYSDTDSLAEEIAVANVFAASRMPPSVRYVPPGADDSMSVAVDDSAVMAAESGVLPLLLGTVVTPDGAKALLQFDPATEISRLYGVGEGEHGYRVVSISPRVVVLRGPSGRVELRLEQEERQ